jgi:hypothetical protein
MIVMYEANRDLKPVERSEQIPSKEFATIKRRALVLMQARHCACRPPNRCAGIKKISFHST